MGHAQPVGHILLQTVYAILRRDGGYVEPQLGAFVVTGQHLFAPVTQDIGTKTWVRLRTVVELHPVKAADGLHAACLPVIFRHRLMVKHLAEQVAVPPDTEIGRNACAPYAKGIIVAVVFLLLIGMFRGD